MIKFNIRKLNVLHKKHFKDGWMIEIHNLNSVQKGHGQLLLNSIIEVSVKTKLDLCLWTETDKNTQYFERHGFESKGKVGQNKENLMIRYIDR
ncbi:thermostable hemolysin [Staphylococcus ureilyticus]|uniref:thermostable hemolysin n=1 Tax=Staphylococcus ureilyticus TaxID=94138 RepID=UPI0021D155E3|nr:thermostable hemolysin [Staphylococcus ureilyticus]UXS59937.1 thermostable hemolysin [Staphylococcus ureilyticus]